MDLKDKKLNFKLNKTDFKLKEQKKNQDGQFYKTGQLVVQHVEEVHKLDNCIIIYKR